MRILFSSLPSPGHTYPLIPLAGALAAEGHQVLYATGAAFHPLLRDFGLVPLQAGIDLREAFLSQRGPDRPVGSPGGEMSREQTMAIARRVFGEVLPRAFAPDLIAIIDEHAPDLVVEELGNPGAGLAARVRGLPLITHGFGLVHGRFGAADPESFASVAAELGVELPAGAALSDHPSIDLCPPTLRSDDPLEQGWLIPLRPEALRPPGPPSDLSWRTPGRPLVYLTMGTAFGSVGVLAEAIAGLGTLPVDVLVATGPMVDPGLLTDLPTNVRVEQWVQQADVLDEAAVVVHHGGSGTTLGATAAGTLQLFLPQGADQFYNAEAVVRAGAGLQLQRHDVSPAAVVDGVRALMESADRRRATDRLAAEVAAMPSPSTVAAQLPELVEELRRA